MPPTRQSTLDLDAEERSQILGASFEECLSELKGVGVDLVFFTGDLTDRAEPKEYEVAAVRIASILKILAVPRERFFAVPGNHDVKRDVAKTEWEALRNWCRRSPDIRPLGRWLRGNPAPPGIEPGWRQAILQRTSHFWTFLESIGRPDLRPIPPRFLGYRQSLYPGTFEHVGIPIHIIGLDSAWLCGDDNDQGKIVVTEEQVRSHVGKGDSPLDGLRIALVHHPRGCPFDC